ncbi:MAG TPA: hypothetical protein PL041_08985 [Melioribacteraceae bacterium]|nr:hypothetical protein [Melioribacteraceae bacterium]
MKVFIVVPTIRENCITDFLSAWQSEFKDLTVIVVEDNPQKTFNIKHYNVLHYCWLDIDNELGENSWIIPRKTDCVRSFGYYKAYKLGADIIITLDDDCYPVNGNFVKTHINRLTTGNENAWVSSLENLIPRGVPYYNLNRINECVLNHGLWEGIADYDAITQLTIERQKNETVWIDKTIPVGKYFPMCGMNISWKRELTPAMYFLLMGRDYEFDRFGDIWCGIISKKIIDHLGYAVNSGSPAILHKRASNVWQNLKKELPGLPVNEEFWTVVDNIKLTSDSFKGCYLEIAENLEMEGEYWAKLKTAMKIWANLF